MKLLASTVLAVITGMLMGCAQPLPPEKQAYIGEWRGDYVTLIIEARGQVDYKYQKGNISRAINVPLKRFDGDDFIVGVGPLTTTFDVTTPPYQDGGEWKMMVDGNLLTRTTPGERI